MWYVSQVLTSKIIVYDSSDVNNGRAGKIDSISWFFS